MMQCLGVGRRKGEADSGAAEEGGVEHVVLVSQRPRRGDDAYVELLPKVAPLPQLRPEVPHPGIIECGHDRRPRLGVHLDRVPADGVEQVIGRPPVRTPVASSHSAIQQQEKEILIYLELFRVMKWSKMGSLTTTYPTGKKE